MSHAATPPVAPSVAVQLRHTQSQLQRILNWALQPDSLLLIKNTSVSKWTPAQHLEHVNRANRALLGALEKLADAPVAEMQLPNEIAAGFLAQGAIERGKHAAPAFLEIQGVTLDETRGESRAIVAGFKALESRVDDLSNPRKTFPHPVLGVMNAKQWLRFTEIHTFHHLKILCEIVGANL